MFDLSTLPTLQFPRRWAGQIRERGIAPFHVLFALILIVYPVSVLLNLNKAIEFSDTGFYYNSFANMDQIREQTTQFAVVWNLLPIPDSIVLHRLTSWLLIVATSALLASQAWKLVWPKRKLEVGEVVFLYAFGAGAASLQYFWWLPDPSYNFIGYFLNAGSLALTFRAIRLMLDGSRVPRLTILGIGARLPPKPLSAHQRPWPWPLFSPPLSLPPHAPVSGSWAHSWCSVSGARLPVW